MTGNSTEADRDDQNRIGDPIRLEGIGSRIAAAADALGSRKNASAVARISSDTLRRWIAGEVSPSFDAIARLAVAAGVSLDWLATGIGPKVADAEPTEHQLGRVDRQRLYDVVETIEEVLTDRGLHLKPAKKAELILLVYEEIAESEEAGIKYDKEKIVRLVSLAS
ncbi:helix-turn-helix domain-containing protein [Thiohalomonas denitrificans]|uniref:helix-turn-helix domain-containing protein n=1 Tax=Thiohalomonas denitrificans TaxID=415747 RepID=UPI0026F1D764|nr:helix-turn-helix transcriptional regulator [Thiohalomonas denitrificans]